MPESQSWTWVRDVETGHCFDVQTSRLDRAGGSLPGVQVIANKPVHVGVRPRRPKHRTDLAGQPTASDRTTDRTTDRPTDRTTQKPPAAPATRALP